jgi:adenine-specific DNA-methyltransferase
MPLTLIPSTPKISLNAAFLKVRPMRSEVDTFKANLINLIDKIDETEREDNQKTHVRDFLVNTYYKGKNEVNTKGNIDLVIHTASTNKSSVGVIIEAKRPSNKSEWISADKPNGKALQELVLYYLRERIDENNIDIKQLVLTNIYEWYIIDAAYFEKIFYGNSNFVKKYEKWRDGQNVNSNTNLFYTEIAKPFIDEIDEQISCTYFDIRHYEHELRNADKEDDSKLIELYKLLSEYHLLRVPFANDSNSLDKRFYTELLHIIGLTETKEGSKKLIGRHQDGERHSGTILEDAIIQIEAVDKLSRIKNVSQYGSTKDERLFNVGLELSITWINRILFLKLLEGQLVSYHKGDKAYLFLNTKTIKEYDDLNTIFFQVLAKNHDERNKDVKSLFAKVPYLNSSLFEPTELEQETILISNLRDEKTMPIHSQTVLKDTNGQKRTGTIRSLQYLFEFLDAYDFASEGSGAIQEDNKTLINASVLGLIFEKINGYKDGSFFTPGFITMYMCRETIRRAVVQKFNEAKGWACNDITDLYNKIEDRTEANTIINSIKICDPAVGSGHFLVSALNEMIAIKSDLHILQDKDGRLLRGYRVEVINDELSIRGEEGDLYAYNPRNAESQRIQETLFHEKETIIESCLFGVDINPNSVKICRLRLWIELLKNAYYKAPDVLETLPNIDINIKCGNSLISRFALDVDMSEVFKKKETTVQKYLLAVQAYKDTNDKEAKAETKAFIDKLKAEFTTTLYARDPKKVEMSKLRGRISLIDNAAEIGDLFGKLDDVNIIKDRDKLQKQLDKLEAEVAEQQSGKFYDDANAFEWRFEFPEVLNDDGDFVGFNVVIGNPPYGVKFENNEKEYFKSNYTAILGKYDSYGFFIEKALHILKSMAMFGYIIPHTWLTVVEATKTRKLIFNNFKIIEIDKLHGNVFEDATVDTTNLILQKQKTNGQYTAKVLILDEIYNVKTFDSNYGSLQFYHVTDWMNSDSINLRINNEENELLKRILIDTVPFSNLFDFSVGVQAYDSYAGQSKETIINRVYHSTFKKDSSYILELNGSDIERYSINQKKESWISYGDWLAHPRSSKYFINPRILVREITNKGKYKLVCSFSDEYLINYKSILNIISFQNDVDQLLTALAILNSSFISWYFSVKSNKIDSNSFPRVSILDIKKFPLKLDAFNSTIGNTIRELSIQILKLKKINNAAVTTDLESQIDQLVYELYGLTEDEIRIVEGKEN